MTKRNESKISVKGCFSAKKIAPEKRNSRQRAKPNHPGALLNEAVRKRSLPGSWGPPCDAKQPWAGADPAISFRRDHDLECALFAIVQSTKGDIVMG
jgi:hypothetical protein